MLFLHALKSYNKSVGKLQLLFKLFGSLFFS